MPSFLRDYWQFKRQTNSSTATEFPITRLYPCLTDRYASSGTAGGHYFHQDLHVAQRTFANNPVKHVDVGSRVDGFVAHVASFRPIEVIDIRPLKAELSNISFLQADLMSELPANLWDYCDSLSCLHTVEHFGLGRYGDPIDSMGHIRGLRNLTRIVRPGGTLYLSTVIGRQRTEFNAHRVFSMRFLLDQLSHDFSLEHFSYVDDHGQFHHDVTIGMGVDSDFGCKFGCGIFELKRNVH